MHAITANTPASTQLVDFVDEIPPDFDACVQDKMIRAASFLSKPVENIFTISLIFSISLTPFVIIQMLSPSLAVAMMTGAWSLTLIPYVLLTSAVGLKIASLFGCGAWRRITNAFRD